MDYTTVEARHEPNMVTSHHRHGISKQLGQEEIVLFLTILIVAIFSFLLDGFLSVDNTMLLLRNVSVLGILALGMAIVVIGHGIDLAQTTTMSISAAFTIILMQGGIEVWAALACGFALALAIGVFNGWLIAYIEIPALFATLASALFINGLGRWAFMSGQQHAYVPPTADAYLYFGQGQFLDVPVPVWIFAISAAIVSAILAKTNLGRHIYAMGDNWDAARLTGVSVRFLTLATYAICAAIGFLGGVVMSASATSVDTQVVATSLTFDVILVVVIGGVSLHGGRGRIRGVLFSTVLIGIVLNGLTIMNINSEVQNIIKGLLLLAAILIDNNLHPRDEETARQGDM